MASIRTVLGEIPAAEAGRILTHEHLLYTYPGAEFDHRTIFDFDSAVDKITAELVQGKDEYGLTTIVDMTPVEVGRHPPLMAEAARRSGVNIIAITGFFPERIGLPYYWRRQSVDEIAEFFVRDLTEGMVFNGAQTGLCAGMIKIATGQESVDPKPSPLGPNGLHIGENEQRVIRAAGRAQTAVGCAINTHTDPMDYTVTNPGLEQLELLEQEGVDPRRVIIGHAFVNPNIDQITAICDRGAYVQVDHIGIPWRHDSAEELDELMAVTVCELVERGYLDQIVFSYDRWFVNPRSTVTDLDPDMANERVDIGYLMDSFLPRLVKHGFPEADLDRILIDNAARVIAGP